MFSMLNKKSKLDQFPARVKALLDLAQEPTQTHTRNKFEVDLKDDVHLDLCYHEDTNEVSFTLSRMREETFLGHKVSMLCCLSMKCDMDQLRSNIYFHAQVLRTQQKAESRYHKDSLHEHNPWRYLQTTMPDKSAKLISRIETSVNDGDYYLDLHVDKDVKIRFCYSYRNNQGNFYPSDYYGIINTNEGVARIPFKLLKPETNEFDCKAVTANFSDLVDCLMKLKDSPLFVEYVKFKKAIGTNEKPDTDPFDLLATGDYPNLAPKDQAEVVISLGNLYQGETRLYYTSDERWFCSWIFPLRQMWREVAKTTRLNISDDAISKRMRIAIQCDTESSPMPVELAKAS